MNKEVLIITDSSCDLPDEYLEKNNIKFMPFNIMVNEKAYLDKITINPKQMFDLIEESGKISKTSAISPAQFEELFKKYSNDYDIVYIGLGTGFSSSTSSAMIASQSFDNVYVVDSQNLSCGVGLLVNKAVRFKNEGLSAKEIAEKVKEIVPRVRVQFVINTLKYLHMGGRCSGTTRILGTALKIKPIIRVLNNKMVVAKKPIGYNRGLRALLKYLDHDKDNLDPDMMTITHCFADEDAKYLREEITNMVGEFNLMETHAGCVISTHCGQRCIGILYILDHEPQNEIEEE